ncbi:hypothetical protein GOP47_0005793 [Adiantum capillus-veneris]|uniref:Pentatricopeptide repeat-containing protein n=1 Tax=Adiantum capillus-veneris TaxID=13818 RepID=A0A9D4V686_ADICA|nr:hypothetical protein GOP47_0005793 [Adiantum capillus-veneris]
MTASCVPAAHLSAAIISDNTSKNPGYKGYKDKIGPWLECAGTLFETYSSFSSCLAVKMTHIKGALPQVQDQVLAGTKSSWELLNMDEALSLLENNVLCEIFPSAEDLTCVVSKCKQDKNPSNVLRFYAYLQRRGMEAHSLLGNDLISLLVDVGNVHDAKVVYDKIMCPNESSWNALIMGLVEYGEPETALNLYENWQAAAVHPTKLTLVALIKACATLKDLRRGIILHNQIQQTGNFEKDTHVGSALVNMYARCRCLTEAQDIFDKLSVQEVGVWNVLISGYAEQRRSEGAVELFKRMKVDGVSPNADTYVSILKACDRTVHIGQELHAEIARKRWLAKDLSVVNGLIRMYSQCGLLAKAEELFNSLIVRDDVSWNAIIMAYSQHNHSEKVLSCLKKMRSEGISPDAYSLCCSLKACGNTGAADEGQKLHVEIDRRGLLKGDIVLGNALLDMYARCGLIEKAQQVFDKLSQRDRISWNALMSGYVNLGLGDKALMCYKRMKGDGIDPDEVSFLCGLKACGCARDYDKGQELHAKIIKEGLERGLLVGSKLVDMYVKCGMLVRAQEVLNMLEVRDVVSWNALISGYCTHDDGEKALACFEIMKLDGFTPTSVTYICLLKSCGNMEALDKGKEIHDEIARKGFLKKHIELGNALVDMYCKCGSLVKAQEVFYKLPTRDIVSWNTLIAGFVQHGRGKDALLCLKNMQQEGVSPDATTYVCSFKACGIIEAIELGEEIRSKVVAKGFLKQDLHICSSLVDMYVNCGLLAKAQEVFDELPFQDTISWNALISGYIRYDQCEEALSCFARMQSEGVASDAITYVCILKACGSLKEVDKGQKIEAQIFKKGLRDSDRVIGNVTVDMYAKCGLMEKAGEVLDRCLVRDVYTWNALIVGYVNQGVGEEALVCVEKMKHEGISPDEITQIYILKACSLIGAFDKVQELHEKLDEEGSLGSNLNLGVAMLDMYAKSGLIVKAQEVFCKLPFREVVAWNALLTGYALLGQNRQVSFICNEMVRNGKEPNTVTFVSILNSCSHTGLVVKGKAYFEAMTSDHGIVPELEHYTCIIDLLSRAGQLEEAVVVANQLPFHSNLVIWHTVLSACRQCGSVEFGSYAFEHALELDEKDISALTCMANIYTDADLLEEP